MPNNVPREEAYILCSVHDADLNVHFQFLLFERVGGKMTLTAVWSPLPGDCPASWKRDMTDATGKDIKHIAIGGNVLCLTSANLAFVRQRLNKKRAPWEEIDVDPF